MHPFLAPILGHPTEVREAEPDRTPNRWKLRVIHEDDPAFLQKPTGVHEIEEDSLETVVASTDTRSNRLPAPSSRGNTIWDSSS